MFCNGLTRNSTYSKNSATSTFYSVVNKTGNRNRILQRRKFRFLVSISALLNDIVRISLPIHEITETLVVSCA